MTQNHQNMAWSAKQVDETLHGIMNDIYKKCVDAAETYGKPGDMILGANIAGFIKVADAMVWQGVSY